jgi:hypothetical protein
MAWRRAPRPTGPDGERRARPPLLYTRDQLLGRAPIYTRRLSDKRRLAAHLLAVVLLIALTAWWVLPRHAFAGPVLLDLTATNGVHLGDLPTVLFLAVCLRSLVALATRPPAARHRR